jgi:hypothetical protein
MNQIQFNSILHVISDSGSFSPTGVLQLMLLLRLRPPPNSTCLRTRLYALHAVILTAGHSALLLEP